MPRCPMSTVFSLSSASRVFGAANGSLSPLTRISAAWVIALSPLLGGASRQKPLETERPDRGLHDIVEDEPRHGVCGHRRQQNAVAVMAGGVKQAIERTRAEDRRVVATAR